MNWWCRALCVARSVILLKPNLVHINVIQVRKEQGCNHSSIKPHGAWHHQSLERNVYLNSASFHLWTNWPPRSCDTLHNNGLLSLLVCEVTVVYADTLHRFWHSSPDNIPLHWLKYHTIYSDEALWVKLVYSLLSCCIASSYSVIAQSGVNIQWNIYIYWFTHNHICQGRS